VGARAPCLHQLAIAVDGSIAELADECQEENQTSCCNAAGGSKPVVTSVVQIAASASSQVEDNGMVPAAAAAGAEVATGGDAERCGGSGVRAKARASLPGHVAEKFDAVVELLHKLGPDRDRTQQ
jgi:hypothetical protein